jgi:hypothetical protein
LTKVCDPGFIYRIIFDEAILADVDGAGNQLTIGIG